MRQLHRRATGGGIAAALAAAAAVTLCGGLASAGSRPGHQDRLIAGKTGPLEAYAKQTETGFMMGLEYLTGGTMTVGGRKIDGHREGRPAQARPRASRCSPRPTATTRSTSPSAPPRSAAALAMLPVAEEYKKVLIVEPAVADSITGDKWNRYIFRTGAQLDAGRARRRAAIAATASSIAILGAGLRLRPRRREGASRTRSPRSERRPRSCTRSTRRRPPPTSPRRRSASSTR